MDTQVLTGSTKRSNGTVLVSLSFESPAHERACLLLQFRGSGTEARTFEEECASVVQHSLLATEGESWNRLDGSLKELNGLFKGMTLSKAIDEIHAIVALVDKGGTMHVSHAGRGEGYLVRGGVATQITEFSKGKPVSAFIHISSGALESGDVVVFATQRLLRAFTPAQLAQVTQMEDFLEEIASTLESDRESAALSAILMGPQSVRAAAPAALPRARAPLPSRRGGRRTSRWSLPALPALGSVTERLAPVGDFLREKLPSLAFWKKGKSKERSSAKDKGQSALAGVTDTLKSVQERAESFLADLKHPERKRRAHLFLLAGAVSAFLIVWLVVSLSTSSQRNKTRAELSELVQQINEEVRVADNRRLAGDTDAANTILQSAEERAKQVMENESGLFRVEALDLLDRIRSKREELNNIVRVSPRVVVNMSSKDAGVSAQGMIGLGDGEFIVYDRQDAFRVLLNKLDDPKRVVDDELILHGTSFPRFNTEVFLTTGNSVIEMSSNQLVPMKTEDPAGWVSGKAIKTYLRFLYVLAPDQKQIYKYERLNNRYGAPVQYNVNGDLTGAVDMAIDTSVYVLREGGIVLKLLRGETQPFAIGHAPDGILKDATRMYKTTDGNFYFLDPVKNRVIVATDGGTTGESSYLKQYVLEGDQLGTPQDLYVDPDENHLYVLDEKRVYVVDLGTR